MQTESSLDAYIHSGGVEPIHPNSNSSIDKFGGTRYRNLIGENKAERSGPSSKSSLFHRRGPAKTGLQKRDRATRQRSATDKNRKERKRRSSPRPSSAAPAASDPPPVLFPSSSGLLPASVLPAFCSGAASRRQAPRYATCARLSLRSAHFELPALRACRAFARSPVVAATT